MDTAILLGYCPDQKGINARITDFIFSHNGNIEHFDQHIDSQTKTFFMRLEWSLDGFSLDRDKIKEKFQSIAQDFSMEWQLYFSKDVPNVSIFVSRKTHCLYDLLLRYKSGQIKCRIPLIISNHNDCRNIAEYFGIKFFFLPITKDNKTIQEEEELKILKENNVELIILARYMQILTKSFVEHFPNKIINIHHSFLPAFVGPSAYKQAYERGVKIIGATSHYVTEELDKGPIIEQDIVRVSHRDSLRDMIIKGEDLERLVLYRAVKLHLERKILIYNHKTVIFD